MRFWILGSGTLLPDARRGPSAHCFQAEDGSLWLLDCGEGALRSLARLNLPWQALSGVFLSHLHTDHVGGLAPLLFALKHGLETPRIEGMALVGPKGLEGHIEALADAHGPYVLDPGFPVKIQELEGGGSWRGGPGDTALSVYGTNHCDGSLAMKVRSGRGIIGYTGDTGPDPHLGSFLQGSHLMVAECSHRDGSPSDHHLTPVSLAEIASAADPELLLTVHAYPPLDPEEVPGVLAEHGYSGRAMAAVDGMLVEGIGQVPALSVSVVDLTASGG